MASTRRSKSVMPGKRRESSGVVFGRQLIMSFTTAHTSLLCLLFCCSSEVHTWHGQ